MYGGFGRRQYRNAGLTLQCARRSLVFMFGVLRVLQAGDPGNSSRLPLHRDNAHAGGPDRVRLLGLQRGTTDCCTAMFFLSSVHVTLRYAGENTANHFRSNPHQTSFAGSTAGLALSGWLGVAAWHRLTPRTLTLLPRRLCVDLVSWHRHSRAWSWGSGTWCCRRPSRGPRDARRKT